MHVQSFVVYSVVPVQSLVHSYKQIYVGFAEGRSSVTNPSSSQLVIHAFSLVRAIILNPAQFSGTPSLGKGNACQLYTCVLYGCTPRWLEGIHVPALTHLSPLFLACFEVT
jgi:hypothetical protein